LLQHKVQQSNQQQCSDHNKQSQILQCDAGADSSRSHQPSSSLRSVRVMLEVLAVSFRLGLTSFGGPVAHLAYFHEEYVQRRKWMDERSYADLVALCQFLPGPASSQVGMGIGIVRAGLLGGVLAWLGFTLPSVIALLCFALLLQSGGLIDAGLLHGLKLVAVAIVAQAVLTMGQKLAPDRLRATIAVTAAAMVLMWQSAVTQILVILLAAVAGLLFIRRSSEEQPSNFSIAISRRLAIGCLLLFVGLLIALPFASHAMDWGWLSLFDSFYRVGSLVFGGGHVVLPLLQDEIVGTGAYGINEEVFLAGYGAVQAVPGPLFTISAYLGWFANGLLGLFIATIAIFLPSFLLVIGVLPFWSELRRQRAVQTALGGVNAAVVGILLAALYDPIWRSTIFNPLDFVAVIVLFVMLHIWKLPSWLAVIVGATLGLLML